MIRSRNQLSNAGKKSIFEDRSKKKPERQIIIYELADKARHKV
jgi:hypothetical protein